MAIATTPAVRFTPSATKVPTAANYLDLSDMNNIKNEIPEVYDEIHGRYGSQMIDGWLAKTGREIPYASDVITWKEEERLTQLAEGVTRVLNVFTYADHTFRVGEIIQARSLDGSVVRQGRVDSVTTNTFTALCGHASDWTALGASDIVVFADFSEFGKGTTGMQQSLNTQVQTFTTRGTTVKEMVSENRTNMAQKGWIKVNNNGTDGYVWYFLNMDNTEKRFKNARESSLLNSQEWSGNLAAAGYKGKQGAIDIFRQGNIFTGNITTIADAESVIDRLNKQGQLRDNVIYGTSKFCLAADKMLAATNTIGLSYGAFQNKKDMALELSFSGFSLGSYEFQYSGLRYLDNPVAQGSMIGANKINGLLIPSASQTVQDALTGKVSAQPMIHVRHRQYGSMNRNYEMAKFDWENGTNSEDKIRTEFQSEQALVLIGRNNTMIFQG